MNTSAFWWQSAADQYQVPNSLRFRGAQYLTRNAVTPTDATKFTLSCWVKLANANQNTIMYAGVDLNNKADSIYLTPPGNLALRQRRSGTDHFSITNAIYRDYAAWLHVVYRWDNGARTLYVNGADQSFSTNDPTVPTHYWQTAGIAQVLGRDNNEGGAPQGYLNGYLAEMHFVDGQALDPTSFGEFNADGVWVPKKVSGVTYGTNGFYLDFSDPANIGADRSGNGNNWTATGFELTTTTSSNYDWVADSPTDNYPTWNPLDNRFSGNTLERANLVAKSPVGAPYGPAKDSIGMSSGKWYWECIDVSPATSLSGAQFGIVQTVNANDYLGNQALSVAWAGTSGNIYKNGSNTATVATFNQNDVIGLAFDADALTLAFYKNNTLVTTVTGITAGTWFAATGDDTSVGGGYPFAFNSGQLPLRYTAPAGFKPLSTAGMPAVAITKPSDHFTTILDAGANILTAAQAKFSNGLWWIKDRANSNQHQLVDSVRGGNLALTLPAENPEQAYAAPSGNSVAWCWNATEAFTGSGGTIASTGWRNPTAGFSIVSYTGTQANGTVAHGLSESLGLLIVRNRDDSAADTLVWHSSFTGDEFIKLQNPGPKGTSPLIWQGNKPGSSVFSLGASASSNALNKKYIAYCWHSVPGYSSIGKYVGNGSTDGPFVYTGFRPAFVMIKSSTLTADWEIKDTRRDPHNPAQARLFPDGTSHELTGTPLDIVSNGFKLRQGTDLTTNQSGATYVYIAFAEHCFGGSNVSPSPAR